MGIKSVDESAFRIWKKVRSLRYLNPINQEEEKKKFFASKNYNPQFVYPALSFDPEEMKKRLASYKKELDKSEIGILLNKKIDKLILWIQLLESIGKKTFTANTILYYGRPCRELINIAETMVKEKIDEKEKKVLSSKNVAALLQYHLRIMGLEDWKSMERKNLGALADHSASEKTVSVKKGELFSEQEVQRLIAHEVGVHARRAHQAEQQGYKVFLMGTADYELTEEGLAATVEERKGLLTEKTLKIYAGRAIAVHLSIAHSFRYVFEYLSQYFHTDEAYQIAMRAKRGLTDTAQAGAFTKDYIYLAGKEQLKDMKDLKPLFVGRIAREDLKHFE